MRTYALSRPFLRIAGYAQCNEDVMVMVIVVEA
jgi:hypothetical protein